jgi:hypothetical protein
MTTIYTHANISKTYNIETMFEIPGFTGREEQ